MQRLIDEALQAVDMQIRSGRAELGLEVGRVEVAVFGEDGRGGVAATTVDSHGCGSSGDNQDDFEDKTWTRCFPKGGELGG